MVARAEVGTPDRRKRGLHQVHRRPRSEIAEVKMLHRSPRWIPLVGLIASIPLLTVLPTRTLAQDFLFRRPSLTFTVWGGYALPRESSDVFDFTRENLTVERGDFRSGTFGGELAWRASERVDVAAGVEYAQASRPSEFRHWVDTNGLPIEQMTKLARTPLTLTVKGYLFPRGRSISRYAWVPRAWSPYVGAGGGWVWYDFEQSGDFVDFDDLGIFTDHLTARGMGPEGHVLAGAELSLSARLLMKVEYRYAWATATLKGTDFVGFDPIDLSGSRAVVGLAVRM